MLNLRAVRGRAYPRLTAAFRAPSWMITDILLPLGSIAAFIWYYRAIGAPEVYAGYVILGGTMTAFWLNVLWRMAAQFYWEKEIGNFQLFQMAPMSNMALLAGMALGGMFFTSMQALATLALGIFIFGVSMTVTSYPLLIAVFTLTLIALYGMGMALSSLYLVYGRTAWHMTMVLEEPVFLLSGFYFPVRNLGLFVGLIASALPITLGLDGIRQVLFPVEETMPLMPVEWEVLILGIMAVVFLLVAKKVLDRMEYIGRKEGRLTLRWQ
jgi:ABC-2 type transport system permease protein